jgi:hypothetical protein
MIVALRFIRRHIPAAPTTKQAIVHPNASSSSSAFVHLDILFPLNDVDNAFLLKRASNTPTLTKLTAPLPHIASASSSVSPSPFAAPSRASTSNPREQEAANNTADKGNHVPLSCEDESLAPPGENASGDIEMHGVGPDHDLDQGPEEPSPSNASPEVAVGLLPEDPIQSQLGPSRRSSSAHSLVPPRRRSRTPLFLPFQVLPSTPMKQKLEPSPAPRHFGHLFFGFPIGTPTS